MKKSKSVVNQGVRHLDSSTNFIRGNYRCPLGSGIHIILLLFAVFSFCPENIMAQKNRITPRSPEELQDLFRYDGNPAPFLSAHRGGAETGYPENCMATFKKTLKHVPAIMEVDPRFTRDSVIVLHHDENLDRTTTGTGKVSDYTFRELKKLRLKDPQGNVTRYKIPRLEKALKWAKRNTLLLLDRKDVPIETRLLTAEKVNALNNTILMAYTYEEAQKCYSRNPNLMFQVFVNSSEKITQFEKTGIPWKNVVVFVSHQMPDDQAVFKLLHERGVRCILGTSRNLDRELLTDVQSVKNLKDKYSGLFKSGADILETDLPVPVGKMLFP